MSAFHESQQPAFPSLSWMREPGRSRQQIPQTRAQRLQKQSVPCPHFQKTATNESRDGVWPGNTQLPLPRVHEILPGNATRNQPQESAQCAMLQVLQLTVLQKQKSGDDAAYPYHKITVQKDEVKFRYECSPSVQTYVQKNQFFFTRGLRPSNKAGASPFTHSEISCSQRAISELLQRRVSAVISSRASISYT